MISNIRALLTFSIVLFIFFDAVNSVGQVVSTGTWMSGKSLSLSESPLTAPFTFDRGRNMGHVGQLLFVELEPEYEGSTLFKENWSDFLFHQSFSYFFWDNLSFGFELGYQMSNRENVDDQTYYGLNARYYIASPFFVDFGFGLGLQRDFFISNLSTQMGYSLFLSEDLALEPSISYRLDGFPKSSFGPPYGLSMDVSLRMFPGRKDDYESYQFLKKGNLMLGGSGFVHWGNQGNFLVGLQPDLGIFITDRWATGLDVHYSYFFRNSDFAPFHIQNFGGGVFTRYYPVARLFAQVDFGVLLQSNSLQTSGDDDISYSGEVAVGYSIPFTYSVTVEPQIVYSYRERSYFPGVNNRFSRWGIDLGIRAFLIR